MPGGAAVGAESPRQEPSEEEVRQQLSQFPGVDNNGDGSITQEVYGGLLQRKLSCVGRSLFSFSFMSVKGFRTLTSSR